MSEFKNTVTQEDVENSIKDITAFKVKEKTTIVVVELKNGFVLTESSSCVDPANYDHETGIKICLKVLYDKIWELLGFKLQQDIFDRKTMEETLDEME